MLIQMLVLIFESTYLFLGENYFLFEFVFLSLADIIGGKLAFDFAEGHFGKLQLILQLLR